MRGTNVGPTLRRVAVYPKPRVLDIDRSYSSASRYPDLNDEQTLEYLRIIRARKHSIDGDMGEFAELCDRWDRLYYPPDIAREGGADNWPEHESARVPGRVHVSINVYPVYVDVPAALQSVPPIENISPLQWSDDSRELAAAMERVYFAWKEDVYFEEKAHQACVVKSLYGRTAAKVWWDAERELPEFRIVDQPRNLWLGWSSSDYTKLDWALYIYRMTPEAVLAEYGLDVYYENDPEGGAPRPYLVGPPRRYAVGGTHEDPLQQLPTSPQRQGVGLQTQDMVEVYDYWCREPKGEDYEVGRPTPMETYNTIFVGNYMVKHEPHSEYEGRIPYVPLFNTYIPGVPNGRSELYDVEQLIREKEARLSEYGQMMHQTVNAQYWQLVGPEAPDIVPQGLRPIANKVVGPGAGNRIEAIQPWMPAFQSEQYLGRLDREMTDVTGLNDLLRGLAPSAVLSSSKAINALVANYETRARMKRDMFYKWRREVWALVSQVWAAKAPTLTPVFANVGKMLLKAPTLTPRDDLETATMASNLVNNKLWALKRGMDAVGVEDPEAEEQIVKEERTDASLFPADVQVQAALMTTLQQLGMQQQQMQGQQQPLTPEQAGATYAQQFGGAAGMPMMNSPEEQAQLPPEAMPSNAQGPDQMMAQTMIKEGEPSNRLMLEQQIGGGQ